MVYAIASCTGTPSGQAANILRAWVRRDETSLRTEFARVLDWEVAAGAPDPAGERMELLHAVVTRLSSYSDLLDEGHSDSARETCLNLLMHLAV